MENGIELKHCHRCNEWKRLDSFHKNNQKWDRLSPTCKECKADWSRAYRVKNSERLADNQRTWQKDNHHKMREYVRQWRLRNPGYASEYSRRWKENNPARDRERRREWRAANPLKSINSIARRRARLESLPDTLTHAEQESILELFGGCALTGDKNIHWDHVIPISTGYGGTTRKNVVPLRADLNLSKHDKNIFIWFDECCDKFGLSREKFELLTEYLASINEMTVQEYQDYVFSCFVGREEIKDREAS